MDELFTRDIRISGSDETVTFYEPGMMQKLFIVEQAPSFIGTIDDIDEAVGSLDDEQVMELISFAKLVIDSTTDLDRALIDRLSNDIIARLCEYSGPALAGEIPGESSEDDESVDVDLPLNDDGSVDLGEMQ